MNFEFRTFLWWIILAGVGVSLGWGMGWQYYGGKLKTCQTQLAAE